MNKAIIENSLCLRLYSTSGWNQLLDGIGQAGWGQQLDGIRQVGWDQLLDGIRQVGWSRLLDGIGQVGRGQSLDGISQVGCGQVVNSKTLPVVKPGFKPLKNMLLGQCAAQSLLLHWRPYRRSLRKGGKNKQKTVFHEISSGT